ncbi:MAG TPA: hypothetical protein VNN62_27455 [Methylomirabilota bacterium]|nr:hypothetical protein [Methylomirabilota bacterium]
MKLLFRSQRHRPCRRVAGLLRVAAYARASWRMMFLLLNLVHPLVSRAACGEAISATTQELIAEEQALHTTEQTVRSSRTRLQMLEAQLQDLLAQPPANYDQTLARKLAALRRMEVEPKRRTLENLRVQHEDSRKQWERGRRLLNPQLVEAQTAFQAKTMTHEEFCRVRETYQQALRLYLQGMQSYRQGMDLYARALNECADRFFTPYINGFTEPRQWEELIAQLQRGDFLHDILIPMTANAVRSVPPDAPPE